MTLNPQPSYPSTRSYVLKLHRDAMPQDGALRGRLENMSTGRLYDFENAEQLLACFRLDTRLGESGSQVAKPI